MIIDKLNTILNSYPTDTTNYAISKFIKNHILEIPTMSITSIASHCHTSKGQISKYVHAIGYEDLAELKEECAAYISGNDRTKRTAYSLEKNSLVQLKEFTENKIDSFQFAIAHIDETQLDRFIKDFMQSDCIYIYARGHARTLCNYIQNELSTHYKEVTICDVDFKNKYPFTYRTLLLVISIDGNTFHFNQRVIQRIKQTKVKTWLISCNDQIQLFPNKLYIPSNHFEYNDYLIRHMIDFVLKF